jgi:uncharacterized protein YqeY
LKALADKHGLDLATVEGWWSEARAEYGEDYKAVMGTVMKRIRNRGKSRAELMQKK